LFRNLYRDFLKESYDLLGTEKLKKGYEQFAEIAALWTKVADLFDKAGSTQERKHIEEASGILKNLGEKEKNTMEMLRTI
jgi:AmiR/NasT family two-component response regulator